MSLSNYPDGLNDWTPGCPWSEPEVPEKDFEVTCSQSLSRTVTVTTQNYIPGACGVDYEPDDEGGYCACGWQDDDDTSITNWSEEYEANGHHTPLQLIQMLADYVRKDAEKYLEDHKDDHLSGKYLPAKEHCQYKSLLNLIEECESWTDDETDYELD